jgi:serine/threonine-protein kinase
MRVELIAVEGPAEGRTFAFDEPDIFVFGRGLDAHCSVPSDRTISRNHFMIQISPPQCMVLDLNSSNGTIVNGVRYGGVNAPPVEGMRQEPPRTVRLDEGDEVVAGKTTLRVKIVASEPPVDGAFGGEDPDASDTGLMDVSELTRDDPVVAVADSSAATKPSDDDTVFDERPRRATAGITAPVDAANDGGEGPPPPPVEGYDFIRTIGVGGMGAVYLARQLATGTRVAIKVMNAMVPVTPEAERMFETDVSIAAGLEHPNIVKILDRGRIGDAFYFVREYVDGTDVEALLADAADGVAADEAVDIALQALAGLEHVHQAGCVHRDLTPANILLAGSSAPWQVKVADVGLAKSFEHAGLSGLTLEGDVGGALRFMPREQILDFTSMVPTTDVYALGATLYLILTGQPVRKGLEGTIAVGQGIQAILTEPYVPLRERNDAIPDVLAEVVDKALSDDVAVRYQDAGEMRRALEACMS